MDPGYGHGSLTKLPSVSGTGMEVIKNSQKCPMLWRGNIKPTEVPGTDMNDLRHTRSWYVYESFADLRERPSIAARAYRTSTNSGKV